MLRVTPLDPERMGRNGQLCDGGRGGARRQRRADHPQRRRLRAVQLLPLRLPDRRQAGGMHVSYLPRAVAAGARVRAGVEVQRVLVENGRATGSPAAPACPITGAQELARNGRPPAGRDWEVRAKTVISAGGAFGTPELLLRSGLRHPALGRHLHIHPACWVGARYEEEVRGWDGVMQSYYVDEWEPEGILLEATFTPLSFGGAVAAGRRAPPSRTGSPDFGHIGSIGVHLHDHSAGRVGLTSNGSLRLTYRLLEDEARRIQFGIARAAEIHFAAGATEVYPNVGPVSVIPRGRLEEFESMGLKPADLRLEAFHPMSTRADGRRRRRRASATSDGAVHGVAGLYVADASLLPTSVGVNPMMTIIACATHVAGDVAESLNARA